MAWHCWRVSGAGDEELELALADGADDDAVDDADVLTELLAEEDDAGAASCGRPTTAAAVRRRLSKL